jgi:hypothetical protein
MIRRMLIATLVLVGAAVPVLGSSLQDWTDFDPGRSVGTFVDTKGTKIDFTRTEGPLPGSKALKMSASMVEWGGVWSNVKGRLARTGALRFKAKASAPGVLEVGLTDDRKTQYTVWVRVFSEEWEEFTVPLSLFTRTKYPLPDSVPGAAMRWDSVVSLQFALRTSGTTTYWVGPVAYVTGPVKAVTGMPKHSVPKGTLVVQDFALLDKKAYGLFSDEKTRITFDIVRDPDTLGGMQAVCRYDLTGSGWCGAWIRCGDEWEGQDWQGAQSLVFTVFSREPVSLEFGFNDANENAYVALAPQTKGTGWETLSFPMTRFQLNPYWQPEGAKKGKAMDLSRIETFNIAPKTVGKHEFKLREVLIWK